MFQNCFRSFAKVELAMFARQWRSAYSARFRDVTTIDYATSVPNDASTIPAKVVWSLNVSFRKRPVQSRWADFQWEPVSANIAEATGALTCDAIAVDGETQWRWSGAAMDLHPSEGEGYWLNLTSETPCLFVMWRLDEDAEPDSVPRPVVVTASYNEAGRMLDAGDRVDRVSMPEAMQAALAEYTMKFYKPEVRKKVKRNDPFRQQRAGDGSSGDLIVPANSPAARGFDRG
jgi:hypothetical protein